MLGLGSEVMADAAIGGGVLFGLFGYNRGNYMYDSSFRFERFTAGREFAIAQAEQYRGDLRALSALTQKKNTIYSIVASLCMALCVALYCAGRLGLHGPSPPAWIMGLWYTNNAAAFAFMALAIWLATHAAFRAQAASVHLLTRKTRVPVPTLKQLDKARRFASEFEQQNWSDIFRVPYICNSGAPKTDAAAGKGSAAERSRSAPAGRRTERSKASSWVRDEFETDRAGTVAGAAAPAGLPPMDTAPEHFRLYAQVQKEWFAYDIYARVTILLGLLSFVHALGYYGLGHINIELRAFWVAYATGFILMVLHALLLRFDIIKGRNKQEKLPQCQWLGPLAWLPAAVGMSLDFRVKFSLTAVAICWICVFLSYVLQLIYTLRLLELVLPDDWRTAFRPEERIGASWWPESWRVPSSFQHVLYLVAPPNKLQPGQNDIVREVKEGMSTHVGDAGTCPSPRAASSPHHVQGSIYSQMEYINHLFDWAFSDAVFNHLSTQGKEQLRKLFDSYDSAKKRQRGPPTADSELVGICNESVAGINAVLTDSGMQPLSGDEGSGYESAGSARSGHDAAMHANDDPYSTSKAVPVFNATEHVQPWRLVSSIVLCLAISWVFLIGGCVIDVVLGEQALITAPHWSRPPMTRLSLEPHELGTPYGFPWPAGAKPWLPEQMAWHEEKRDAEKETLGSRRLASSGTGGGAGAGLSAALDDLMGALAHSAHGPYSSVAEPLLWPNFFEPQLLACGPVVHGGGSLVAALTPRGFGAAAHIGEDGRPVTSPEPFTLQGLSELPSLLGASWGPVDATRHGLTVVSRGGHVLVCPELQPKQGSTWECAAPAGAPARLPVPPGTRLAAAAAAWLKGLGGTGGAPRLHAAFVDETMPELAAIFVQDEGTEEDAPWYPLGEVRVPRSATAGHGRTSIHFAGDGDLVLTTGGGALLRQRLRDGAVVASAARDWGARGAAAESKTWQAACTPQHGHTPGMLMHLRLRRGASSLVRRPELVSSVSAEGNDPLFE